MLSAYNKDIADKFVDGDVNYALLSKPATMEIFNQLRESIYEGDIEKKNNAASEIVGKAVEKVPGLRMSLKAGVGSYPMSAVISENIISGLMKSGVTDKEIDNLKNYEDLDEALDDNGKYWNLVKSVEDSEHDMLEEVEETSDMISSCSYSSSEDSSTDAQDISIDNYVLMKNNKTLKYILGLLGNLKRIYTNIKRTTPGVNPEMPDDYEFSGDITRILPDYFAQLDNEDCPELELLFLKDLVEESLLSQRFISKEQHGGGDIRLFLDHSSSMNYPSFIGESNLSNTRLSWAYASAAALHYILYQERKHSKKRLFETTMFAQSCATFDATDMNPLQYIKKIMEYNNGMSTIPQPAIMEFCRNVLKGTGENKCDMIIITDGQFDVPPEMIRLIEECKATRNLHIFAIYIGTDRNSLFDKFCDVAISVGSVIRSGSLQDEEGTTTNTKVIEALAKAASAR